MSDDEQRIVDTAISNGSVEVENIDGLPHDERTHTIVTGSEAYVMEYNMLDDTKSNDENVFSSLSWSSISGFGIYLSWGLHQLVCMFRLTYFD